MTEAAQQQETAEQVTIANIDSVFEGDDAEETAAEEVTDKKEETKAAETDSKETKGDKTETPADEEQSWTKQAALDERHKRQTAEKRVKELEEELAKGKQEEAKVVIPDPVEDPEGYAKFIENKQNKAALETKISLSRDVILSLDAYKTDYEEMENHFIEMVKENPVLIHKMNASPNPAKFAYDTAKEDKEIRKLKDPKYKETLEAEIRAKILAEMNAGKQPAGTSKAEQRKKSAVEVPDLTKATAKGSNSEPVEKLPGLSELFDD